MSVDPKNLIAAINPDVYCKNTYLKKGESPNKKDRTLRDLVKTIAKEKGYLEAAKKAKLVDTEYLEVVESMFKKSLFSLEGIKNPVEQHTVSYDMVSQNLEPLYFNILDWLNSEWGKTKKITDNFISSAGSGFFSEYNQKKTRMQDEAIKLLQTAGIVTKSILNVIYDLKEFKMVLSDYDTYRNAETKAQKNASGLALKQRWIDKVDINKGNSSLKGLAQQFEYVTLIDAFMVANNLEDVTKPADEGGLDLNDRVKRILQQRIQEFYKWVDVSEGELRKRYEIERLHLRNQVASLKLYARWLKPYLKATRELEQNAEETSDIVNAFNTTLFELTILGLGSYGPDGDIATGDLPEYFKKISLRNYSRVVLVEFRFRSVPDISDQARRGYTYRGKADITFTSFALNSDELDKFEEEMKKDDLANAYQLIEDVTSKSLGHMQDDIDEFLNDDPLKNKEKERKKSPEDINPFTSLFSFFSKKEETKKSDSKIVRPDTYEERVIRGKAGLIARIETRKAYNTFKKTLGMVTFPPIRL